LPSILYTTLSHILTHTLLHTIKMKFGTSILCAIAALGGVSAFVPPTPGHTKAMSSSSSSALASSWLPAPTGAMEFFPLDIPMKRIEGGGTVRTWDIPPETERLQYVVETNGRPLKAKVEL
jgi:hypothetical protein